MPHGYQIHRRLRTSSHWIRPGSAAPASSEHCQGGFRGGWGQTQAACRGRGGTLRCCGGRVLSGRHSPCAEKRS